MNADAVPPGWFHHGAQILALVDQYRPQVCVELGSWQGASAIAVARAIRRWRGVLYCVDTWTGMLDQPSPTTDPPVMIAACARHMVNAGVAASVRLIPATTRDAAAWWTGPAIDFLYVDADHAYPSVLADLEAWTPFVRPGGLILGDDYDNPDYPGVRAAWDDFERRAHLTLTRFQPVPGLGLIYGEMQS